MNTTLEQRREPWTVVEEMLAIIVERVDLLTKRTIGSTAAGMHVPRPSYRDRPVTTGRPTKARREGARAEVVDIGAYRRAADVLRATQYTRR